MARSALLALAAAAVAAGAAGGGAAVALRPPAGEPDPRQMVVRATDLGAGATVSSQRYYQNRDLPSVISYERELEGGRVGRTRLAVVGSSATVGTSVGETKAFLDAFKGALSSREERARLREALAGDPDSPFEKVQLGRLRSLGAGDDSIDLLITARALGLRLAMHLAAFRVDRVVGLLVVAGLPGERVPVAVVSRLAKLMTGRARAELSPRWLALPSISGVAELGQTLTAAPGRWRGNPMGLSYRWLRCDAAGARCAPIPQAADASYVVAEGDVGSTIRVQVTATNSVGSSTAISLPTAPVPAPAAAPVSTSPPTVTGTAEEGQVLAADPGLWANSPTSFSYQWQRCDAAGATCVDISGATASVYAVTGEDRGFRLRVAVTAANAAGSATAPSAPTPVVP